MENIMEDDQRWYLAIHRRQRTLILYALMGCCVLLDGNTVVSDNTSENVPSVLVFTSLINPPFLEKRENEPEGFIPDLVKKIALRLRTPYNLKLVAWGAYGVEQSDGSWNGMIGEVIRGEADVAAGALSILPWRQRVVDFTLPFMQAGIATIVKAPPDGTGPPVLHPKDLASQSEIKYGCIPGSLTYRFFQTTNDTVYKHMYLTMLRWSERNQSVFEWTSAKGAQRVRESGGKYAFFVESSFAEFLVNEKPCDLMMLDEFINPTYYAFAVQKNSRLKNRINRAIQTLLDNGVVDRFRQKWWKGRCRRGRRRKKNNYNTRSGHGSTPKRPKDRRREEARTSAPPATTSASKPSVQRSRTRSVWKNSAAGNTISPRVTITALLIVKLLRLVLL